MTGKLRFLKALIWLVNNPKGRQIFLSKNINKEKTIPWKNILQLKLVFSLHWVVIMQKEKFKMNLIFLDNAVHCSCLAQFANFFTFNYMIDMEMWTFRDLVLRTKAPYSRRLSSTGYTSLLADTAVINRWIER